MAEYLEFKQAKCKNCYKCLRECPVKAIDVKDLQAKIIDDRCILCGKCTIVCPQNAKFVHSDVDLIWQMLEDPGNRVIASVAPSFVSSFDVDDFQSFKIALGKLSFADAEETAVGAKEVSKEYKRLLESGEYKNLITSACPAACRMIQLYYPSALKYLAPVDSPMIAHAKMLRARYPDAKIIFIGPCIAKKREAKESGLLDGVLTFEDLKQMFDQRGIVPNEISHFAFDQEVGEANLAKHYPTRRGIIKSFGTLPAGYEYIAIDGAQKCVETLANIEYLSGTFLELSCCVEACINGPCSLVPYGGSIRAMSKIHNYVDKENLRLATPASDEQNTEFDFSRSYPRMRVKNKVPTEQQIKEILARTGKFRPEDELNCGACGYSTCREKAWAVINGYVDIEVCLPYMRERAESMSYEVIQSSQNGIVVLDFDMNILEINTAAKTLLGIEDSNVKMKPAADYFDTVNFIIAMSKNEKCEFQKVYIPQTKSYINQTISLIEDKRVLFAVMTDITSQVNYNDRLIKVKQDTLSVTDNVIKKQMRVAQEIASLLGETTAETKVALLKLKTMLQEEERQEI